MFVKYYTPELREIHPGFICEIQPIGGGDFVKHEITKSDIEVRCQFLEQIRVQKLHRSDFTTLGLSCEAAPSSLNSGSTTYLCVGKINHPREKLPVTLIIYFIPSTDWTMITIKDSVVFAGFTMNISELNKTLKRIQADDIQK